jgi:hypothetical protein
MGAYLDDLTDSAEICYVEPLRVHIAYPHCASTRIQTGVRVNDEILSFLTCVPTMRDAYNHGAAIHHAKKNNGSVRTTMEKYRQANRTGAFFMAESDIVNRRYRKIKHHCDLTSTSWLSLGKKPTYCRNLPFLHVLGMPMRKKHDSCIEYFMVAARRHCNHFQRL